MFLSDYIEKIERLCRLNGVKNLYAFGSVLSEKFTSDSDVDLVVEIDSDDPLDYAEKYFNLKFELEKLLNRKVDLLESKAIKNSYLLENINTTKTMIYAA